MSALAVLVAVGTPATATALAAGPPRYTLVQYPDAGLSGLYAQINGARRSIDMEMYELADPTAERDLVAATRRGVAVRVLLDSAYEGETVNAPAVDYLQRHGVPVRWAPRGYIFHIKATSFDRRVSDISTANLEAKYYSTTRDAEIIDRNPLQVRAIEGTFTHDWNAAPGGSPADQTVQAAGLVWSPNTGTGTAETALVSQIRRARHTVDFSSEELSDPDISDALARDAERGVACQILMTRAAEWDSTFDRLSRAGCQVHTFADASTALYIHEKLIIDDPEEGDASMWLGSQNASETSLTRNRELGIVLRASQGGAAPISQATATFDSDFNRAAPWSPRARLAPRAVVPPPAVMTSDR